VMILGGEPAVTTLAASTPMAEEGGREGAGGQRLPAPLRTREHVSVMRSFDGPAQEGHRARLPGHLIEDRHAHSRTLARDDDVGPTQPRTRQCHRAQGS
jgi:hypothetical protein